MKRPIMIMAGGTGGHVFPALAVADKLREQGVPVVWMGTQRGIEARLVPDAGYPIEWLSINGLRGKGALTLFIAPLKLFVACWQAMKILFKTQPAAVLGMGGFVSGPGGVMARLLGKPLLIHEQNAIPGMTNRLLARIAAVVMESFPDSFQSNKPVQLVGNPVRESILAIDKPELRLSGRQGRLRIVVIGGSLGALVLNNTVPEALSKLQAESRPEVRHQTGHQHLEYTKNQYQHVGVEAQVVDFIEDMADAYSWADLVICRAGAMTISELSVAGVASILIPYPHAVDDHQTANALYLAESGAAILVPQTEFNAHYLANLIKNLSHEKIYQMSLAAKQKAKPEATERVAHLCLSAGGGA